MNWLFGSKNNNNEQNEEKKDGSEKSLRSLLTSILSTVRVGTDVLSSGISLPSWIYEPLSILQRQTEMLEYSMLLDSAAECQDTIDRMVFVAALAVSGYSGTQRYHNNFNPILGETFEFVDEKRDFKFLAEQVSHHPPISATRAIHKNWEFYQNSNPKTSFLGNAIEIDTQGRTHIYFSNSKDHFFYTNPVTRIHNLIIGKMWIEHYGELNITNLKNGDSCNVTFQKSGFFSNSSNKNIHGQIKDPEGNVVVELRGVWDEFLEATWLVDTKDSPKGKIQEVWRLPQDNFLGGEYNFSKFASSLNLMDERHENILPPTDSRLRLDRRKLEDLEYEQATRLKKVLEERQRADKKRRIESNEEWIPQWFHKIPDKDGGHIWVYCGDYWEQRELKQKGLEENTDVSNLLDGGRAKNTATDFKSYVL